MFEKNISLACCVEADVAGVRPELLRPPPGFCGGLGGRRRRAVGMQKRDRSQQYLGFCGWMAVGIEGGGGI